MHVCLLSLPGGGLLWLPGCIGTRWGAPSVAGSDLHPAGPRLGAGQAAPLLQRQDDPGARPALRPRAPPAGPFISVVLSKLENMLENSLHVNLLLIGIITQLASYPQPLLRSFLLNTNMVFQPSVRSLYQVGRQVHAHPCRRLCGA